MERKAFARARTYLNAAPLAKWSALLAAIGTGVLFVALLIVLGLFADFMVHRGEIAPYEDLLAAERDAFHQDWNHLTSEERQQALQALGTDEKTADQLAADHEDSLTLVDRQRQWRAFVYHLLQTRVSDVAAEQFAESVSRSEEESMPVPANLGILSLVVRSRHQLIGPVVGWLARWNPWMWQSSDFRRPNYRYLTGLLGLALVLALVRAVLLFLTSFMAARATLEATTRLRRAIYHQTFRLGTLAFRALGPSEGASVFTRHVEAVHDGLYAWLTVVLREPVKFGLLLAFALAVNFWLSLAFLLFAFLVWLIGGQVAAIFRRQGRQATRQAADHLALLQESLMLMRLVKCYLMELFNQSRVERQLAAYTRAHLKRYRGEAIYPALLVYLGTLVAMVLLYVAGLIVLNGRLGVTSAIMLVAAVVCLYWPLANWLTHRPVLRRARDSAFILFKFLERRGEVGQAAGAHFLSPMRKMLEFDQVSLKEPGTGRILLDSVSLKVQAGERVALVGAQEMEKHALVYLIPRFLDPNSGEIRIDQQSLRLVTLDSLRFQIALVLLHNLVFNDTVANNISCGDPSYKRAQVIDAAKVAHAHQFILKLPHGYDTSIGEMGHTLTTGEQFRIALARAILRDPALLIVEEPASALLDDDNKAMLDDTYARILPGRTAILLPHRISTIRSCDRVYLLHKGRIESEGPHKELLAQNELYQHLYYLEFNMFAGQL